MKTLYMHIGWRKTGTSAIQSFITQTMQDGKLGDIAVVPFGTHNQKLVTGDNPIAHHGLANFKNHKAWVANWDKTREFVAQRPEDRFLVTSELFSSHISRYAEMLPELAAKLDVFDKIVMPCWIRRQDHFMASMRVQKVKHGGKGSPMKDSVKSFPSGANYFKFLAKLSAQFPKAEMRPNLYSKSNDLIASFIKSIDLDPAIGANYVSQRINSSVSADMYRLQATVNQIASARKYKEPPLQQVLIKAWDTLPSDMKKNAAMPMTRAERVIILEHFKQPNIKFCKKYGFDPAFFQPSEAELDAEPAYNIPETVPDNFRQAIRAALVSIKDTVKAEDYNRLIEVMDEEAATAKAAA